VDVAHCLTANGSSEALQFNSLSELLAAIHDSLLPNELDLVSLRTARSLGGVAISRYANHDVAGAFDQKSGGRNGPSVRFDPVNRIFELAGWYEHTRSGEKRFEFL
jgi:hypothetical protein